jgi:hypothetical protein
VDLKYHSPVCLIGVQNTVLHDDLLMKKHSHCWVFLDLLVSSVILLTACSNMVNPLNSESTIPADGIATVDPSLSDKLQQDIALTAQLLTTLTPPSPSTSAPPLLTTIPLENAGTPLGGRVGTCPIPAGFVLQELLGYCVSTPSDWAVFNIDGGMAGNLKSTPGQAISIQPSWAQSSDDCSMIIYVAHGVTLDSHLRESYVEFSNRRDLNAVSTLGPVSVGTLAFIGFNWSGESVSGGVYAAPIRINTILHLSYGGTNCPLEQLVPVIETLRFN